MADGEFEGVLSGLQTDLNPGGDNLFLTSTPLQDSPTGYISRKVTLDQVSTYVNKILEYAVDLDTDDKTVLGAINELKSLIDGLEPLSDEQKDLILSNFLGGVYTDSNGLNLYKALKHALYPDEPTPREGLLEMSDIYKTRYLDGFSISVGNINYGWPNPGYYVFNPEIKKIQIGSIASGWGNNWFIFRKIDDNTYYGIQSDSVVRINDNGSGISITSDSTGGMVKGLTSFNWGATRTLELANNNLYLTDADGNSFYVTNANIIGTFGDGDNRCGRWSGVEAVAPQVDITTIENYATKEYVDNLIGNVDALIGSGVIE